MVFDPIYIIFQIISVQCAYYLAMGTLWGLCHVIFETTISLDHFFTPKYIHFTSFAGFVDVLCTFLSAMLG